MKAWKVVGRAPSWLLIRGGVTASRKTKDRNAAGAQLRIEPEGSKSIGFLKVEEGFKQLQKSKLLNCVLCLPDYSGQIVPYFRTYQKRQELYTRNKGNSIKGLDFEQSQ
jgi:hypothetical protein